MDFWSTGLTLLHEGSLKLDEAMPVGAFYFVPKLASDSTNRKPLLLRLQDVHVGDRLLAWAHEPVNCRTF